MHALIHTYPHTHRHNYVDGLISVQAHYTHTREPTPMPPSVMLPLPRGDLHGPGHCCDGPLLLFTGCALGHRRVEGSCPYLEEGIL